MAAAVERTGGAGCVASTEDEVISTACVHSSSLLTMANLTHVQTRVKLRSRLHLQPGEMHATARGFPPVTYVFGQR